MVQNQAIKFVKIAVLKTALFIKKAAKCVKHVAVLNADNIKMKITKKKLENLIKEELILEASLLNKAKAWFINKITNYLMQTHNQDQIIDQDEIMTSPGNFLKFNIILNENSINIKENILKTFKTILDLYKKSKNLFFKDFLLFYSEYYLKTKKENQNMTKMKFIEDRKFLLNNINDFFVFNLSQGTLLRSIENRFFNE